LHDRRKPQKRTRSKRASASACLLALRGAPDAAELGRDAVAPELGRDAPAAAWLAACARA